MGSIRMTLQVSLSLLYPIPMEQNKNMGMVFKAAQDTLSESQNGEEH